LRRAAWLILLGEARSSFYFEYAVQTNEAFRSTGARQDAETLHGIDPGFIIVRVAQNSVRLPSIYPKLISRANLLAPRLFY
jgi:hypothetical protein